MRHVSGRIFQDSFFASLPAEFRLLWIGLLICCADDQGRMLDNARDICLAIFPGDLNMDPKAIEAGLRWFAKEKKILRYRAGGNGSGRQLIQIVNWWTYQLEARWAARSKYPAPPRWVDRIRWHIEGNQIEKINWEFKPGGFIPAWRTAAHALHRGYLAPVKPVQSREDDIDIEDEDDTEDEDDHPTPQPPPTQGDRKAAGGRDTTKAKVNPFDKLKRGQRRNAERIAKILAAASFRDTAKRDTLSVIVATRISQVDPITLTLAALASAYADDQARNKMAVAAHRIEHDQIDPAFCEPRSWDVLPAEILAAAGIDDLRAHTLTAAVDRILKPRGRT